MTKKKIVFLSGMAFDADISIIKRLRDIYDVYFLYQADEGAKGVGFDWHSLHDITCASDTDEFNIVSDYLDLDKTFLIRHHDGEPLKKLLIEPKVARLIHKINPDVLLVDRVPPALITSVLSNRKRCISIIHDPFPHSGEDKLRSGISRKFLIGCGKRYILFNSNQREDFERHYNINDDIVYSSFLSQYEFINLFKSVKPFRQGKDSLSTLKVLFFGRIEPYKGIKYLYEAAKKYLDSHYDLHLVIAGKGDLDFTFDEKYQKDITIINKFIDTDELRAMIDWCDIVVCPYTDATQSGVIMSSYALCKPVLATRVGGLPEMLKDGELGMIIPPKSSDAIYESFVKINTNRQMLTEYSKNIEREYFNNGPKSWEKAVKPIIEAIESL